MDAFAFPGISIPARSPRFGPLPNCARESGGLRHCWCCVAGTDNSVGGHMGSIVDIEVLSKLCTVAFADSKMGIYKIDLKMCYIN